MNTSLSRSPIEPGPWAELHCASSYSFLRGASEPEDIALVARDLGITTVACLDRDGLYGAARWAYAAREQDIATVFGAELSLWGVASGPLTVLCRGVEGYRRLSHLLSDARMASGLKDAVDYPPLEEVARRGGEHWIALLDGESGHDEDIVQVFGSSACVVEYRLTQSPADTDRNARLRDIAERHGLRGIVSCRPTCATPAAARLAGVKAALHHRQDVSAAYPTTHPMGGSWLRSRTEVEALCGDCSWLRDAMEYTLTLAEDCAFALSLVAPELPDFPVPEGHDAMSWLRALTERGAHNRYGPRPVGGSAAWDTIERELAMIEQLGFPGYFLIIHDIVDFCRTHNILCQGRGSAANSAVCFALGITNVDAVAAQLLFERFLSPERDGPPDIDLDIESGRREEVIQYVYHRYGRDNAAQVANVITYRRKGALRDAGRALGYQPGVIDGWSRGTDTPPERVAHIAEQLRGQPRHLGIHSGGMVICDRPIADVVPIEWARKEQRSVVQWDKDDCAAFGLVKFDLLGLGMLEALHHAMDQVRWHRGRQVDLWRLDPVEKEVYDMLCRADAIGVFQVESRAQLNTLPRLKPRTFFDLVVEVALIRPGPIQGGSVHPYIRRRNGEEAVTFDHPSLEPSLTKTMGIPLFQEQLMQIAVDVAGFSGAEADSLRRAMGSRRSPEKMQRLRDRFYAGAAARHGISTDVADTLWAKIVAFAAYGFPESHAQSFAALVYYSAWFKHHYPAEFCVALLRAQPMGFYSPQSLISDARRHGVTILPPDINLSLADADSVIPEPPTEAGEPRGVHGLGRGTHEALGALRLGLASITGISQEVAEHIVDTRLRIGSYRRISDLSREAGLSVAQVENLARAGALDSLGMTRREALWAAGIAATERPGMLPGTSDISSPALPGMSELELTAADLASTGITPEHHPMIHLRADLATWHSHAGGPPVVTAAELLSVPNGTRVRVAGLVTHRQRPQTASGLVFLGLEDETGLANISISPGLWDVQRRVALSASILVVRGIVYNASGAATMTADRLDSVDHVLAGIGPRSRDFR